jgi:uncharacterized coiled-coil DUF342 family protein
VSDDPASRMAEAVAKIEHVSSEMDRLFTRLEAMHASIDSGALERLEAGQTKLRIDVMERIDRLANGITGIHDDISVNMGTADAVRRAHNHTREELRDLADNVSTMYRILARLEIQIRELKGDP